MSDGEEEYMEGEEEENLEEEEADGDEGLEEEEDIEEGDGEDKDVKQDDEFVEEEEEVNQIQFLDFVESIISCIGYSVVKDVLLFFNVEKITYIASGPNDTLGDQKLNSILLHSVNLLILSQKK